MSETGSVGAARGGMWNVERGMLSGHDIERWQEEGTYCVMAEFARRCAGAVEFPVFRRGVPSTMEGQARNNLFPELSQTPPLPPSRRLSRVRSHSVRLTEAGNPESAGMVRNVSQYCTVRDDCASGPRGEHPKQGTLGRPGSAGRVPAMTKLRPYPQRKGLGRTGTMETNEGAGFQRDATAENPPPRTVKMLVSEDQPPRSAPKRC